ncbi:MAG: hypothetical protein QGI05_04840, partial [Candidatus Omnitrophota bacterium]|nr:hypothetical protein [Candidatus Omnitrophota bacterium]
LAIVIFSIGLKTYPSFVVAALLSSLLGIFASPIVISANTLLHEAMKDEMRGRIFSSLEIIMHIGFLVFMVLTSLLAERIGKGWILVAIGAVFFIIGLSKLISGLAQKPQVTQ